jgi:glycosyltransferase involved in cell wall biosynthesis
VQPRVALVHDFFVSIRGADRVFLEMCDLYPEADIFLPIYDEKGTGGALRGRRVHTSFLQRLRPTARTFRALLPLYPAAIESFDLSGYDLVISSSSAWAHAVICDEDAVHVCYCYNPFRYVWNERHRTVAERRNPLTRAALSTLSRRWREWDWIAAQRVDHYVAISDITRRRIRNYFGREASVVYPPVDTGRFTRGTGPGDYYLVLSELVSHKRIDDAVRTFTDLNLPLVVVGDGPDARRLKRMAGPTVSFAGRVDDEEASRLVTECRALVLTAVEEFGIAGVEVQAAGRPVIAQAGGGALETVIDGVTGCFYSGGPAELAEAVTGFDTSAVDPQACIDNAARFDRQAFREAFKREVASAMEQEPERPSEIRAARRAAGERPRLAAVRTLPGRRM